MSPLGYAGCIVALKVLMPVHPSINVFIHPSIQSSTQLARYSLHHKTPNSNRSPTVQLHRTVKHRSTHVTTDAHVMLKTIHISHYSSLIMYRVICLLFVPHATNL